MKNNEISFVNFHGNAVPTILYNAEPHVGMKAICEQMGLDWEGQRQRILRDEILQTTTCMIQVVAQDGKKREMVTLPLEMFNGWLFGIDANRVKPEIKGTILAYQRECFKVLYNHWHGKNTGSSSPIRLHETRVKLLKELHKADTQPMRESIYQSLQAVSQELGLPLLPMEDFQTTHDKEALKVCSRFWATVELIRDEAETPVNHSNNLSQIAINLPEIIKLADKHDIDCPSTTELRRYLRSSGNPRFNGIRAVRSCLINEPKKCWVFEV